MAITIERTSELTETRRGDYVTLSVDVRALSGATILATETLTVGHNMRRPDAADELRVKFRAAVDGFAAMARLLEADLPKLATLQGQLDAYIGTVS